MASAEMPATTIRFGSACSLRSDSEGVFMRLLKPFSYSWALAGSVLLTLPMVHAQDRSLSPPAIVVRNCSGCHEMDGRSQLPYIPRVAGLNAGYLERKLASFQTAPPWPVDEAIRWIIRDPGKDPGLTRPAVANMVGIAHAVSDTESKAAVAWYAAQTPVSGRSAKPKLIEEGRSLFMNGLHSQGLVACKSCH